MHAHVLVHILSLTLQNNVSVHHTAMISANSCMANTAYVVMFPFHRYQLPHACLQLIISQNI